MSINQITHPLPGERVVALSPEDATAAATDWPRRPNLFPGRALTDLTLQGRQRWQAGHIAVRGQAFTPGIAHGLETSHQVEDTSSSASRVRLFIEAGQGLAVSGEDVVLDRRMECLLADLPVIAPPAWFVVESGGETPTDSDSTTLEEIPPASGTLHPRAIGGRLEDVLATAGSRMPNAGVLLLQPVTVDVSDFDPNDPCDRCPTTDEDNLAAFEDWRIGDGVRLLWYPWPEEWQPMPTTQLRQRNALAHLIFAAEAELSLGEALPWEEWGVPVALAGLDSGGTMLSYIDRAAVARQGGRAREARLMLSAGGSTALAASSRLPALWQARIEQFAEQIAGMGEPPPDPTVMADPFLKLPPCGLLPKSALDLADFRSDFFPPLYTLDAVPVPIEQLDLALREAAPMAPLDLAVPERVRLMVPVSQASWEPRLLHQEVIDPEFQQTLNRFLLTRSRLLGARQGLRAKEALLAHALDGQMHEVVPYADDPLAVEPESLSPWGPPPAGGGHRASLASGIHQHLFVGADTPFVLQSGESLFVWVHLDPDNPPRTLMLQWHLADGDWEHRVYWGEDLIPWGIAGGPAHLRMGDLPEAGAWLRLTVPAASVGLAGAKLDGMSFALYDGRAAYGMAGAVSGSTWRKWFCNLLPDGVGVQGDESWDFLSQNDLWEPFAARNGVYPITLHRTAPDGGDFTVDAELRPPASGYNVLYQPEEGWRGHVINLMDHDPGPLLLAPDDGSQPAGAKLLCSVFVDELTPPSSLWIGLELSVFGDEMSFWPHSLYWGENRLAELAKAAPQLYNGRTPAIRAGALPATSGWLQIEIPLPANLEGTGVYAVRFLAYGGSLAFSDLTYARPRLVGNALQLDGELIWPRQTSGGATHTSFTRVLSTRVNLQSSQGVLVPTASARIGSVRAYKDLMRDDALARLSGHERSQLVLRGVQGFADYIRRRIDRADDITDFGFAHMQVDMYRVRNLVMSTSDVSRLAVSPALAAIAKSDSALTVQSQIKEYLAGVKSSSTQANATNSTPRAALSVTAAPAAPSMMTTASQAVFAKTAFKLIQAPKAPANIVYSMPVVGLSEVRTTAIAERLKPQPSTDARDYALANRHTTVSSLLEILEVFLDEDSDEVPALFRDFLIYGLEGDPFLADSINHRNRPLLDFRDNDELLDKLLDPPAITDPDEADLFNQTVSLSDNTIAILRQLERRLVIYRDALGHCETTLEELLENVSGNAQSLRSIRNDLAEARHDVAVARALMAEEQARLDAINTRRARVLEEEVRFLAFARPRQTGNLLAVPHRVVDPALQEAPVPACLRAHNDVSDELEDMLRVVREAPASWFMSAPTLFDRLDRIDQLTRVLKSAQQRLPLLVSRPLISSPGSSGLGNAITQVLGRQTGILANRVTAVAKLDIARLATASWKNVCAQVREVVSLGDLIDGEHGKGSVARQAAVEYDGIAAISACLHAEFCGVSAAIRLDWAEMISQFDEAPDLRNLANLPRWSEIDSTDRRQMQAYADWLFSRVEARQDDAVALINDVIRMCLLLASHAPVGRIVAGRLPRPVTAVRPGIRIPLVSLEPAKARVGMQAIIYRAQQVVARAVVEDVGSSEVSARVLYTSAPQIDLDTDARVHFDDAEVISAAPKRTSGIFKR